MMNCGIILDIIDMSFENSFFDVIICNRLLEHIKDDQKAMSELFRVLNPKEIAILQVPISKIVKNPLKILHLLILKIEKNILGKKTMLEYMEKIIKRD